MVQCNGAIVAADSDVVLSRPGGGEGEGDWGGGGDDGLWNMHAYV